MTNGKELLTRMDKKTEEILRVNHAGELGAQWIYEMQIKYSSDSALKDKLEKLRAEEEVHCNYFENEIGANQVRPSALYPLWKLGAKAMGGITGLMGKEACFTCTEAVESVIIDHYKEQLHDLEKHTPEKHSDLKSAIENFLADEERHHHLAEDERAPSKNQALFQFVRGVTQAAVKLAKKF